MNRASFFKSILWIILGLGLSAGITRMIFGLGSVTNLSDTTPWGLWKGFNVIPGIALAAGGFVLTAIIYVLRKEEYHRYARFSVLLALLGYITAATALVAELGLPWLVWHPVIYWQHHSALFEVAWCVMLYLVVLFLEFIPVPLEETGWLASVRRFLNKYKIILVILGIMISTLHQSSLGTLFLITPEKLHPLWYSALLPLLFFISAVAIGPLMVILAVNVVSYLYRKGIEKEKLARLGLVSVAVLVIYGLIRFVDLGVTGKFPLLFEGSWPSIVFWIEILMMLIIPIICLSLKRLRSSRIALSVATASGVLGMGLNRANVAGIMLINTGPAYIPTIYEIFVSLAIISAAILIFLFCVERFKMWEIKWEDPRNHPETPPQFDSISKVWLGTPRVAHRSIYSLIFIISLALGFSVISGSRLRSEGVAEIDVTMARGGDTLFIDGNRDNYGVAFPHLSHSERYGPDSSCVLCHHMNIPFDKTTPCYQCHRQMYTSSDVFRHDWHADPAGGNIACQECHPSNLPRAAAGAKTCDQCHSDLLPEGAQIEIINYDAPAYTDAMHILCIDCHQKEAQQSSERQDLDLCTACHVTRQLSQMPSQAERFFEDTTVNHVIVPRLNDNDTGEVEVP